jgi:antitoxin CptB
MEMSAQDARLKKLRMRSWRRGMKEMDLILGPYADAELDRFTPEALDAYEALLDENDQDLYLWVTGAVACRPELAAMIARIAEAAGLRRV